MSISNIAKHYMDQRESLTEGEKAIVEATFDTIYRTAHSTGTKVKTDDRAAELEGALIRFLIESRGE